MGCACPAWCVCGKEGGVEKAIKIRSVFTPFSAGLCKFVNICTYLCHEYTQTPISCMQVKPECFLSCILCRFFTRSTWCSKSSSGARTHARTHTHVHLCAHANRARTRARIQTPTTTTPPTPTTTESMKHRL